jgi:hypothetical protein
MENIIYLTVAGMQHMRKNELTLVVYATLRELFFAASSWLINRKEK